MTLPNLTTNMIYEVKVRAASNSTINPSQLIHGSYSEPKKVCLQPKNAYLPVALTLTLSTDFIATQLRGNGADAEQTARRLRCHNGGRLDFQSLWNCARSNGIAAVAVS